MVENKRKSGIGQVVLFVAVTACVISAALYFTVDRDTLPALSKVEPLFFPVLLLIWLANASCDSLSLKCLTAGTGERLKMSAAFGTSMVRIFFNVITPFNVGGQPFMVYYMGLHGIPAGKASSVVITKLMSLAIFSMAGAGVAYHFLGDELRTNSTLNHGLQIAAVVCLLFVALLLMALLYPHPIIVLVLNIRRWLKKTHLYKSSGKHKTLRLIHAINQARHSFRWFFKKRPGWFALGLFFSVGMYLTDLLLIYFSIRCLGISLSLGQGLVLCSIFELLLAFMPTPGAAGLGEVVYVLLFSTICPTNLLGVALLVWRFFYHYIGAVLGCIAAARQGAQVVVPVKKTA